MISASYGALPSLRLRRPLDQAQYAAGVVGVVVRQEDALEVLRPGAEAAMASRIRPALFGAPVSTRVQPSSSSRRSTFMALESRIASTR